MLGALGLQTGVSGRAGIEPAETPKAPLTARHSVGFLNPVFPALRLPDNKFHFHPRLTEQSPAWSEQQERPELSSAPAGKSSLPQHPLCRVPGVIKMSQKASLRQGFADSQAADLPFPVFTASGFISPKAKLV